MQALAFVWVTPSRLDVARLQGHLWLYDPPSLQKRNRVYAAPSEKPHKKGDTYFEPHILLLARSVETIDCEIFLLFLTSFASLLYALDGIECS
jgi:hypothetical protein